jgi:hypothetical protein
MVYNRCFIYFFILDGKVFFQCRDMVVSFLPNKLFSKRSFSLIYQKHGHSRSQGGPQGYALIISSLSSLSSVSLVGGKAAPVFHWLAAMVSTTPQRAALIKVCITDIWYPDWKVVLLWFACVVVLRGHMIKLSQDTERYFLLNKLSHGFHCVLWW